MTTIGSYEFPEYTFSECLGYIERVKDEKIATFDTFLTVLGHKNPKSSGVGLKMGALNKYYGLLEKTGKDIRLTPVGEKIVYDLGERVRNEAIQQAIFRVPLIKDLYGRLHADYNAQDFKPVLHDLTGATPAELQEKAESVERVYRDAVTYLRQGSALGLAGEVPSKTLPHGQGHGRDTGTGQRDALPPLPESVNPDEYHVYQSGAADTYVRVRRDIETLEVVKGMIQVWLDQESKSARPRRRDAPADLKGEKEGAPSG